jgi:hypothetical protein
MTPEERFERIERNLEFLASNQAHLSSSQAQLSLSQEQLWSSVQGLRDVAARHDAQIFQLTDVVSSLARITEEQGRRIQEQAQRTDERMNTLVRMIERHLSDGHK